MSSSNIHCRNRSISDRYQEPQSPTMPSKMIKELPICGRVPNELDFLVAPKRKRGDSIDGITASRQQETYDEDDFVYPLQKRYNSSTHPLSACCTASCDSERRDGPAEEDDVHDEETEALVKKFRTSIFRQERQRQADPSSPSSSSTTTLSWSAALNEDEGDDFFELPSIQRATTICDDSLDVSCYSFEPPEISSRPASPQGYGEDLDNQHDWSVKFNRHDEEDPIIAARMERPLWQSSPTSSMGPTQPSPLWNMSEKKQPFWPEAWTGTFHQGSA